MPLESDFDQLGRRILEALRAQPQEFGEPKPLEQLPLPPSVPGLPEFVLESEAGLLLGEPPARSFSLALPVTSCLAGENLAWTFGANFAEAARHPPRCSFLQVLLVESAEPLSRSSMSRITSLRSLAGRLPGYLAHSVGAETTARIHRSLLASGLTQDHLAQAHLAQARQRGFGGSVAVAVGIPSPRALELFAGFQTELRRLNATLSTSATASTDGPEAGCNGKTCSSCDERDVCDKVRAVLAAHAENNSSRGTK